MKYYIVTIEQTKGENEGSINEYGKIEKKEDYKTAETAFYQKLANVSADIGVNHYYMDIKIVNSEGGIEKKDKLGAYQPVEA